MKYAVESILSMLILAFVLSGCAAGTETATTSTVVNILAAVLGITPDQATAGTGSLLGLASEKLTSQDYAKVAAAVPGSAGLVQKAGALTGLGNKFGSMAKVTTALEKLGLTSDQVQTMATNLGDIAGKTGGDEVKGLLMGALK